MTSGAVDDSSGNGQAQLTVTETSVNAAGNYSTVSWSLVARDNAGLSWSGTPVTGNVTINGASSSYSYGWSSASAANRTLSTGSVNIAHDSAGNKTLSIGFTFSGISGTSIGAMSASGTFPLTKTNGTAPTATVPGAPGTPSNSGTNPPGGFSIAWSGASNGGAAITDYEVQISTTTSFAGTTTRSIGNHTSATWTGLPVYAVYYVRVRAENSVGWGAWSGLHEIRTGAGVMDAPTFDHADVHSATSAGIYFVLGDNNGAAVDHSIVVVDDNPAFSSEDVYNIGVYSSVSVYNLKPNTTYYTKAYSDNSVGASAYSNVGTFTTPPGALVSVNNAWVGATIWVSDGTAWDMVTPEVSDGTTWTPIL